MTFLRSALAASLLAVGLASVAQAQRAPAAAVARSAIVAAPAIVAAEAAVEREAAKGLPAADITPMAVQVPPVRPRVILPPSNCNRNQSRGVSRC